MRPIWKGSIKFGLVNIPITLCTAVRKDDLKAALPSCQSARPLRPFTTDGCSSFPDGTISKPDAWHSACVIHDIAYWRGGTYGERRAADQKLRDDVAARGYPRTAKWMYCGVRFGGSPWWPTKSRWGYGWPWGRGYRPLSESEMAQTAALLPGVSLRTPSGYTLRQFMRLSVRRSE